jgi:hypothetical protein
MGALRRQAKVANSLWPDRWAVTGNFGISATPKRYQSDNRSSRQWIFPKGLLRVVLRAERFEWGDFDALRWR